MGRAVIDDTDPDAPTFSCVEGNDDEAQHTLTLRFDNNPLTVSTGQTPTVYVSVPAVLGDNIDNRFTIKIYTHQGSTRVEYTRSQSVAYSGSIYRNQWANVPFALSTDVEHINIQSGLPDGILNYNYVFSVSATQKVYFSQGNLQYDITNNRWQFAATQQETIGDANYTNLRNNSGVIDLFGWGTSGVNGISPTLNDDEGTYATRNLTVGTTGSDWGSNVIYNGALPENASATWRTLKSGEFNYMLGLGSGTIGWRNVDGVNNHYGRNYDFDIVNLNGTIGVLIYPDAPSDVTQPGSLQYLLHPGFTNDDKKTTFDISNIGLQNLPGCVFLPASLQRGEVSTDPEVTQQLQNMTGILAYWTATYNNPDANAFVVSESTTAGVTTRTPGVGSAARNIGQSVRLVYNAN